METGISGITGIQNYSYVFSFEKDFDIPGKREWMRENWQMCFYYIGAYMLVVFGGQLYMQTRPRFELRVPLVIWNTFLSLFSIWGAYRSIPELIYVLNNYGFHYSCCIPLGRLVATFFLYLDFKMFVIKVRCSQISFGRYF